MSSRQGEEDEDDNDSEASQQSGVTPPRARSSSRDRGEERNYKRKKLQDLAAPVGTEIDTQVSHIAREKNRKVRDYTRVLCFFIKLCMCVEVSRGLQSGNQSQHCLCD